MEKDRREERLKELELEVELELGLGTGRILARQEGLFVSPEEMGLIELPPPIPAWARVQEPQPEKRVGGHVLQVVAGSLVGVAAAATVVTLLVSGCAFFAPDSARPGKTTSTMLLDGREHSLPEVQQKYGQASAAVWPKYAAGSLDLDEEYPLFPRPRNICARVESEMRDHPRDVAENICEYAELGIAQCPERLMGRLIFNYSFTGLDLPECLHKPTAQVAENEPDLFKVMFEQWLSRDGRLDMVRLATGSGVEAVLNGWVHRERLAGALHKAKHQTKNLEKAVEADIAILKLYGMPEREPRRVATHPYPSVDIDTVASGE